MKNRNMEWK